MGWMPVSSATKIGGGRGSTDGRDRDLTSASQGAGRCRRAPRRAAADRGAPINIGTAEPAAELRDRVPTAPSASTADGASATHSRAVGEELPGREHRLEPRRPR
jgi:hypothetical protein